jgi:hypothetical protein
VSAAEFVGPPAAELVARPEPLTEGVEVVVGSNTERSVTTTKGMQKAAGRRRVLMLGREE